MGIFNERRLIFETLNELMKSNSFYPGGVCILNGDCDFKNFPSAWLDFMCKFREISNFYQQIAIFSNSGLIEDFDKYNYLKIVEVIKTNGLSENELREKLNSIKLRSIILIIYKDIGGKKQFFDIVKKSLDLSHKSESIITIFDSVGYTNFLPIDISNHKELCIKSDVSFHESKILEIVNILKNEQLNHFDCQVAPGVIDLYLNNIPDKTDDALLIIKNLLYNRKYQDAFEASLIYKKYTNNFFLCNLSYILSNKCLDFKMFIASTHIDNYNDANFFIGKELVFLNRHIEAIDLLYGISMNYSYVNDARKILITCIENKYMQLKSIDSIENELEISIQYISKNNLDLTSRMIMLELFNKIITEDDAICFLTSSLNDKILKITDSHNINTFEFKTDHDDNDSSSLLNLVKNILKDRNSLLVWETSIPNTQLKIEYVSLIKYMIPQIIDRRTYDILLHILINHEVKLQTDNADILILYDMITLLSLNGDFQDSRDLAEFSISNISQITKRNLDFRSAYTYMALADSYHRSNHLIESLYHLNLSAILFESERSKESKFLLLNLSFRIFRDLKNMDLAIKFHKESREYAILTGINFTEMAYTFDFYGLMLPIFIHENRTDELINTFYSLNDMLSNGGEQTPIISLQVAIINYFTSKSLTIPDKVKNIYDSYLTMNLPIKIKAETIITPSINDLDNIFNDILGSRYINDQLKQLSQIDNLCSRALSISIQNDDYDLYIKSSYIKTLYTSIIPIPSNSTHEMHQLHSKILHINPIDSDIDRLHQLSTENIINIKETFLRGFNSSTSSLINTLSHSDVLIIAAKSKSNRFLILTKENTQYIEIDDFHNKYCQFKTCSYPDRFQEWEPPTDIISNERFSINEIYGIMQAFRLDFKFDEINNITIILDPQYFGAPINLFLKDEKTFLIEAFNINIEPSLNTYLNHRLFPQRNYSDCEYWFGGANTSDFAILGLKGFLSDCFNSNNIHENSFDIPEITNRKIVFLCSHGDLIQSQFKTISNGSHYLSENCLSSKIVNNSCVVLFVCSSGRSDQDQFSGKINSFIKSLSDNNNLSIIAPIWQLNTSFAKIWAIEFIDQYMRKWKTIAEANKLANLAIKNKFYNPCAYGNLHVYGAGHLTYY